VEGISMKRYQPLLVAAGFLAPGTAAHAATSIVGGPIDRSEILERALSWLTNPAIRYSQKQADAYPDGDGRTYRPDCSGYVSMAWHLDRRGSDGWDHSTETLPRVSHAIGKDDLRPGDIMLRQGGDNAHVTLFNGWRNAEKSAYNVLEQGAAQVGHEPSNTSIPHEAWYEYESATRSGFKPYRYNNVVEDTAVVMPRSGSPAVYDPINGHLEVYYPSGGAVAESWWQRSGWSVGTLPATITDGRPVAVFNPVTNNVEIYFNSGGKLAELYYTPDGQWHSAPALAGSRMTGSPAVVYNAGQQSMEIYFNDGGKLSEAWWHAGTWSTGAVGDTSLTGSPSAVYNEGNGHVEVYFNANGKLAERYWSAGAGWNGGSLNAPLATAASPSALYNPGNHNVEVYFADPSGVLTEDYWTASTGAWSGSRTLGGTISQGDPVALFDPAGNAVEIYFNSGGKLAEKYSTGGAWYGPAQVGGTGAAEQMTGSPMAAFNHATGNLEVYLNSGGALSEYYHSPTGWSALVRPGGTLS
jgi:hypothetical protein